MPSDSSSYPSPPQLPGRPDLTDDLTGAEFERWYWLKDELAAFARTLGIRATGGKAILAARISAALDGREFTEPTVARRVSGAQLAGPLTAATVIPPGQRCSQVVRAWMTEQVGAGFGFDAPMREFFAAADGTTTMADALDHWYATRDAGPRDIGAQFEYNRFTRAWYTSHPDGTRAELLDAWREHRSRPIDERDRIDD